MWIPTCPSLFRKLDWVFLAVRTKWFGNEGEAKWRMRRISSFWFLKDQKAFWFFLSQGESISISKIYQIVLCTLVFSWGWIKSNICVVTWYSQVFFQDQARKTWMKKIWRCCDRIEVEDMMSCFRCCMSEEKIARKSLKKSIKEYHDTKTLNSFANISFKTGKFFETFSV